MSWHLYILSVIFVTAGVFHLIRPKAFMRIMPLYIPYHRLLVYLSGIAEILAGLGVLFIATRTLSIWAIIAMLILFFPVHIHMLMNKKASLNFPRSILFFRLFLQFGLIYWAYQYI
ncbi:MauE/DoxX family redox-associated membrane protein [Aquimarina gracilis]|uniref:MauE/DoxX family redox-associated membrane protein n=1 Tax=Aquimarina gracilis TaxID=874422 RepID=A0ABU5ZYG4_9FLAO|nr:MauE/DoxX family redox-associated membrane protein [Aquimarina gracilis]MEB3346901.1 MauE/DoxX family redox-associated membrane protein [Aquimarina gracilis]